MVKDGVREIIHCAFLLLLLLGSVYLSKTHSEMITGVTAELVNNQFVSINFPVSSRISEPRLFIYGFESREGKTSSKDFLAGAVPPVLLPFRSLV